MLTATKEENTDIIQTVAELVEKKGYDEVRADLLEGYESPSKLVRKNSDQSDVYVPDVTGIKRGRKDYFEIALKTDEPAKLASKWKLLGTVAKMKRGSFFLVVPKGHFRFASEIIKKYDIEAELIKL